MKHTSTQQFIKNLNSVVTKETIDLKCGLWHIYEEIRLLVEMNRSMYNEHVCLPTPLASRAIALAKSVKDAYVI